MRLRETPEYRPVGARTGVRRSRRAGSAGLRGGATALTGVLVLLAAVQCRPERPPVTVKPPPPKTLWPEDPFQSVGVLEQLPGDTEYKFRPGPRPPERAGQRITQPFPPLEPPPSAVPGRVAVVPLRVLHASPKGLIYSKTAVNVTFNQPMVPLAAVDKVGRHAAPLELTPKIKGRTRWLGVTTARFELGDPPAGSTRYVARVPKGTRSALGAVLDKDYVWHFETPRLELSTKSLGPMERNKPLRPSIALVFNQRIQPDKLFAAMQLVHQKSRRPLRLEWIQRERWKEQKGHWNSIRYYEQRNPGRVMVVRPVPALAFRKSYELVIRKGVVGGEGELPTTRRIATEVSTHLYDPFRVQHLSCPEYELEQTEPGTMTLAFNNAFTAKGVERLVRLRPRVKGLSVKCEDSECTFRGHFKPGRFTATVSRRLKDSHGQLLGPKARASCDILHLDPRLGLPATHEPVILEAQGSRRIPIHGVNLTGVPVTLVQLPVERFWDTERLLSGTKEDQPHAPTLKGRRVTLRLTAGAPDRLKKVGLPVDRLLGKGGTGLLYLELRPRSRYKVTDKISYYRRLFLVTDLGIAVRYDRDRMLVLVTSVSSGLPVAGARIELFDRGGKPVFQGATDSRGFLEIAGPERLGGVGPRWVYAGLGKDKSFAYVGRGGTEGWAFGYYYRDVARRRHDEIVRSLVFTERNPYRPGETVHVTGILRLERQALGQGLGRLSGGNVRVKVDLYDARYKQVIKGRELEVTPDGMFTLSYEIPKEAALGQWTLRGEVQGVGTIRGRRFDKSFQVLHYRTPEYRVGVNFRGAPRFLGESVRAEVTGRYFFGSAMVGAEVRWTLRRWVGSYRPPNHALYRFGELPMWTFRRRHRYRGLIGIPLLYRGFKRGKGKLDANGRLKIDADIPRFPAEYGPGRVGVVSFEAEVVDRSRQVIAASARVVAHPSAVYVGLRPTRAVLLAGRDSVIEVIAADLQGKRVAGRPVKLTASRLIYDPHSWYSTPKETPVGGCSVTTTAAAAPCRITLPKAGQYVLRASTTDAQGRATRTGTIVYAVGPTDPAALPARQKLELLADKAEYKPGDTASILIKSPYPGAVGILAVERNGIRNYRLLRLTSRLHLEKVKLGAVDIPNVHVSVFLVRGRIPGLKPRKGDVDPGAPEHQRARVRLSVSLESKRLQVSVQADPSPGRPGKRATLRFQVRDNRGRPARARLAVMAVDEGVLSLLGYQIPDPVAALHHLKPTGTALRLLRAWLLDENLQLETVGYLRRRYRYRYRYGRRKYALQGLFDVGAGGGGPPRASPKRRAARPSEERMKVKDKGEEKAGEPSFQVRAKFATTALYTMEVETGADGKATLPFTLPDNLTTFRVTAVAVDRQHADRFGKGETQLTVQQPLMLMPALPRFANFGDRFEAAVKVTNETGRQSAVKIKLQVTNAIVIGPKVKTVELRQGQTEEVRFPVAVGRPGRARFRFLAYVGGHTDAVATSIPVNLPATAQAFATYGVTTGTVAQPLLPPKDALPGFGGLDLSYASTALTGLEDSVRYLVEYPYGCTEQLSSRLLPLFALSDILPAFGLLGKLIEEGSTRTIQLPAEFLKTVPKGRRNQLEKDYLRAVGQSGIAKLLKHQQHDGGFGLWARSTVSPYLTAYATFALLRGRRARYGVPDSALERAASWLDDYLRYGWKRERYGWWYSSSTRLFAAWVLSEMADASYLSSWKRRQIQRQLQSTFAELYRKRQDLALFGKALLMVGLHRVEPKGRRGAGASRSAGVQALLTELDGAAVQDTPYRVHFQEKQREYLRWLMHSNTRTDAIVLSALMEVAPDYALVPKIVRGLIEARVNGRWESTQANSYALIALNAYFQKFEKVEPNFRLRAWLGEGYLGETRFEGRSMKVVQQRVPMSAVLQGREKSSKSSRSSESSRAFTKRLVVQKTGPGKLYYRLGLRYAPRSLRLPAQRQGFTVQRVYEPTEGKSTVTLLKDGTYRIKAGALVRVRITVTVPSRRFYVAVDDPLPAGFEIVDTQFRTTSMTSRARRGYARFGSSWYWNHREKRDDRVLLFADRLWGGVYEYVYLARATTLGTFIAPPARAEEMYHPEVFGHTATAAVQVVPK